MFRLNLVARFPETPFGLFCRAAAEQNRNELLNHLKNYSVHELSLENWVEWRPFSYLAFHGYTEAVDFLKRYVRSHHDEAFGLALAVRYKEAMQIYQSAINNPDDCRIILQNIAAGLALRCHIFSLNTFIPFVHQNEPDHLPYVLFEVARGLTLNSHFGAISEILKKFPIHESSFIWGATCGFARSGLSETEIVELAPDLYAKIKNNCKQDTPITAPESTYYSRMNFDKVFSDKGVSKTRLERIDKRFPPQSEMLYITYGQIAHCVGLGNFPVNQLIQHVQLSGDSKLFSSVLESICDGYIEGGHSKELFDFLIEFKFYDHIISLINGAASTLAQKDPLQIWPFIEFIAREFRDNLFNLLNIFFFNLAFRGQMTELYDLIDNTAKEFPQILHLVIRDALEGCSSDQDRMLELLAYIKKNQPHLLDTTSPNNIFAEEKDGRMITSFFFWDTIVKRTRFAGSFFLEKAGMNPSMTEDQRVDTFCELILNPDEEKQQFRVKDYFFVPEEKVWRNLFHILEPQKFISLAEDALTDAHRAETQTLLGKLIRFNDNEESPVHNFLKQAKEKVANSSAPAQRNAHFHQRFLHNNRKPSMPLHNHSAVTNQPPNTGGTPPRPSYGRGSLIRK